MYGVLHRDGVIELLSTTHRITIQLWTMTGLPPARQNVLEQCLRTAVDFKTPFQKSVTLQSSRLIEILKSFERRKNEMQDIKPTNEDDDDAFESDDDRRLWRWMCLRMLTGLLGKYLVNLEDYANEFDTTYTINMETY